MINSSPARNAFNFQSSKKWQDCGSRCCWHSICLIPVHDLYLNTSCVNTGTYGLEEPGLFTMHISLDFSPQANFEANFEAHGFSYDYDMKFTQKVKWWFWSSPPFIISSFVGLAKDITLPTTKKQQAGLTTRTRSTQSINI